MRWPWDGMVGFKWFVHIRYDDEQFWIFCLFVHLWPEIFNISTFATISFKLLHHQTSKHNSKEKKNNRLRH